MFGGIDSFIGVGHVRIIDLWMDGRGVCFTDCVALGLLVHLVGGICVELVWIGRHGGG